MKINTVCVSAISEVDMTEQFDIMPKNGVLKPGESETVELTCNALCANLLSADGLAVCEVEGGPEYEFPLKGDSKTIAYNVSTTSLDFGDVPFTEMEAMEFKIENTGDVNI